MSNVRSVHRKCSSIKCGLYKSSLSAGAVCVTLLKKCFSRYWRIYNRFNCYILLVSRDTLSADSAVDMAMVLRRWNGWSTFRQLVSVQQLRTPPSLWLEIHSSCTCMVYLHAAWQWNLVTDEIALDHAEISIITWICGVKMKHKLPSIELKQCLKTEDVIAVVQCSTIRWIDNVPKQTYL